MTTFKLFKYFMTHTGEGGVAGWGGGSVDAGYVDAFLAAALTRVMSAVVPIPEVTPY